MPISCGGGPPHPLLLTSLARLSSMGLGSAAQDLPEYGKLIEYWMTNRYTLRYTGGLVPDICQQFSKGQGVLTNPPGGPTAPAKLRLAFEAAPFSLLVEQVRQQQIDLYNFCLFKYLYKG